MSFAFGGDGITEGFGEGPFGGGAGIPAEDSSAVVVAIDHIKQALGRVIKQYQGSMNLLAFIAGTLEIANELESVLLSLMDLPDIDMMQGVNLDVIGEIVGQSRNIVAGIDIPFFGFADTPGALGFGELTNKALGGPLYELGATFGTTTALADPEYRILIRSRIIKNSTNATPNSILASLAYLFNTQQVNIDDYDVVGTMHIRLAIGVQLDPIEKLIVSTLDILPRPAGVQLDGVVSYDPSNYFGFSDQPNALGFGELGVFGVGGIFAEEIFINA